MLRFQVLNTLLHLLVFFLGAGIGSFLNVVIYRLPRAISVNNPRRSFCPSCQKQIPWYRNIPVVSWIALRGKCASCGASISPRYVIVEIIVGLLFYAVFLRFGGSWHEVSEWGPAVFSLWLFLSLLVAGTFIDIEHFILPHEITIGGAFAGMLCAYWAPQIVGVETHGEGIVISFVSAMLGFGLLWTIVELGKLAFGRVRHQFAEPEPWAITQPDENAPPVLTLQGETYGWADLFSRKTDRLLLTCPRLKANERAWSNGKIEIKMETLTVHTADGQKEVLDLESVTVLEGTTSEVVIPREAMGFGDVLFIAMIGAFTGWKGVLFSILAASVIGTVFALVPRLIGRQEWSAKIPFGPYLAAGAAIWVFWGAQLLGWYLGKTVWRGYEL